MQLTFNLLDNQGAVNHLNIKLSVSSVILCLALTRYFYIQDQWHKHVQKFSDSRLNALQARIKPHFLFNSLNSIASLITIDPDRAELAIATFSNLMRRTFTHKDKWITIAQEIEWVEQYLAIEKLRLDQRLSYEINCENDLYSLKIPVLCLQPLVENAILHGIQPIEQGGQVNIDIYKQDKKLIIQVCNPFIPMKNSQSNGMAMENIAERLKLQYGNKTQMQINNEDAQYQVRLVIPL
jgi:two-component system sensor histidine kinase AlgZ